MRTLHRMGLAAALAATVCTSYVTTTRADAETAAEPAVAEAVPATAWYAGGNLHKATAREWVDASLQNQLATASDWVMTSKELKAKVNGAGDMEAVRPHADKLRQCINAALRRHSTLYDKMPASDIAMTCLITMKF
jgi:hypothetical protein